MSDVLPSPTFQHLCDVAFAAGVDRVSLVREPKENRKQGVCVMLIGSPAIREVGDFLRQHIKALKSHSPMSMIQGENGTTIPKYFEAMELSGFDWCYVSDSKNTVLITFILGDSVTKEFCKELTKRGCPTYLE